MSCKKIDLLFSRSWSLQELIWSKYDNFYCIFCTADPFATKRGLIVHYHKPECPMKKIGLLHSGSRSQWRVKLYVCPADIFYTIEHFVFKLGIVIHHYESECHAKRLICYFQGQGHGMSSYDQNMTIPTMSFELLFLCYQTWFDSTVS